MLDIPLDTLRLWKLARKKSDLCESSSGNSKPKSTSPKNINIWTIASIYRQPLAFIYRKANKTFVASYVDTENIITVINFYTRRIYYIDTVAFT